MRVAAFCAAKCEAITASRENAKRLALARRRRAHPERTPLPCELVGHALTYADGFMTHPPKYRHTPPRSALRPLRVRHDPAHDAVAVEHVAVVIGLMVATVALICPDQCQHVVYLAAGGRRHYL